MELVNTKSGVIASFTEAETDAIGKMLSRWYFSEKAAVSKALTRKSRPITAEAASERIRIVSSIYGKLKNVTTDVS